MFCPKCGTQLPDNAAFCGKCGAQLGARKVTKAGQASRASQTSSAQKPSRQYVALAGNAGAPVGVNVLFTPAGLAARVVAVVAAICMFVPWASVPALNTISDFASQFGVGSGGGFDYSIPALHEKISMLASLPGGEDLQAAYAFLLFAWVVALLLLVAGLVVSFVGKSKTGLLAAGCLVVALIAVFWALVTAAINSAAHTEIIGVAGGCIGTIIFGSIGFILSIAGNPKAA